MLSSTMLQRVKYI